MKIRSLCLGLFLASVSVSAFSEEAKQSIGRKDECLMIKNIPLKGEKYDYRIIDCLYNGWAKISKEEANGNPLLTKQGIIDNNGKEVIPPDYIDINVLDNDTVYAMKYSPETGVRMGMINLKNQIIIPFDYSLLSIFSNGVLVAVKGCDMMIAQYSDPAEYQKCRFGVLDGQNRTLVPFTYNFISSYKNGVAIAQKGKILGKIDKQGKIVVPFTVENQNALQKEMLSK